MVANRHDDYNRWKPDNMRDHLTAIEVARLVGRDKSRIFQLERMGVLPKPVMVKVGMLKVRLYSPKEVAKIKEHFKTSRPGQASPLYGRVKRRTT